MTWFGRAVLLAVLSSFTISPSSARAEATGPQSETIEQSICRLIEAAARERQLPAALLTRLIWQESSFRPGATSRAGAQGVAQFMPGTARARGLADPFDPEQAIPAAAALVADLAKQFGNLGLAAAAYNAGSSRVTAWLAGQGGLPAETRDYVARITGRMAEDWAAESRATKPPDGAAEPPAAAKPPAENCLQVSAELRRGGGAKTASVIAEGEIAPWGVQLAGGFSKSVALAAYARNRVNLAGILGDKEPMILGGRLRYRGAVTFYRIRVPAPTRAEADGLCRRIRAARGACAVLKT